MFQSKIFLIEKNPWSELVEYSDRKNISGYDCQNVMLPGPDGHDVKCSRVQMVMKYCRARAVTLRINFGSRANSIFD